MTRREWIFENRTDWPSGPWDKEPDAAQWRDEATGLECYARRGGFFAWCGYVGVPEGHALYGARWENIHAISVHGGLTWSDFIPREVSGHLPDGPALWWLGFDCGHHLDIQPGMAAVLPDYPRMMGQYAAYRTLDYLIEQVTSLALQVSVYRGLLEGPDTVQ